MMQSDQGFQSHLFKSMHSYICNQNRVQPIIGLSSITELCTDTKPPVYLCEVCVLRANITDIKTHIMGSLHRYNYIKSHYTYELGAVTDLGPQAWHLLLMAQDIEKKEGTGNVQVLHLHEDIYKEMTSQPVLDVLAQVKQINKQFQLPLCRTITKDDFGIPDDAPTSSTTMFYATGYSRLLKESQDPFKTQNPVQCWLPPQMFHPGKDTTEQSSARTAVQVRAPILPGYPLTFCIPYISPTTAFSPVSSAGAFQRGNSIGDSVQNVTLHDNTVESWGNGIHPRKRVAQCQNNSDKVTIPQIPNTEHIKGQENVQDHFTSSKLISTGAHTPPVIWDDGQCLVNNYFTREELPFRHAVGQEDSPFTADDTLSTTQYHQLQDHLKEYFVPQPKYSEESLESYRGTQPLIGLHAVIKCQNVNGDPPSCCYLCQPCSLKVLKSDIIHHLISPLHQINYINFQYPHLSQCCSGIESLQTTAIQLEQEEGRGQMEVRRLPACLFNILLEQDFHGSMKMLSCGLTKEIRLNQKLLRKRSSITPDYNSPVKPSAGFTGIAVDCHENGATEKPLLSHKRPKIKGTNLKKTMFSEPVFKVSLLLNDGPLLVDRLPLVTATVAPEIE